MKPTKTPINISSKSHLPTELWQAYEANARRFAFDWAHETDEKGEADSFWDEFLLIRQFDWAGISPEIFGSLFQEVLVEGEPRSLSAHFTSEKNILRLIEPLFLDQLREEFKGIRKQEKKLETFRRKLHGLRFLDPACGCGNFLVVTYRELRRLDFDMVRVIRLNTGQHYNNYFTFNCN